MVSYLGREGRKVKVKVPGLDLWFGKTPCRRDRLPTPVFLGFSCGSAGKESACTAEDPGSIPGSIPWRREWLPTPVLWPGEFQSMGSQRVRHN